MTVNILVVEDESIVAMEIKSTLEGMGYSVPIVVNSGEKAIIAATEQKPDIILMDIRLKGELDGIEAAEKIRSHLDVPIIFLTAHAETDKLERAKLTLPYGYLLKPVQERDLKVTLEMALYASKIEAERRQAVDALQKMHDELEDKVKERTLELKKAKDEAEFANSAKSDFLNKISHELRTPMHHIISFSRFGINKTGQVPDKEIIDYFQIIFDSGSGLLNLLNDLLDLSKLESGKMDYQLKEASLEDIFKRVTYESEEITKAESISIELIEPGISTDLVCDGYKIAQVIRNLITNAVKFSTAGNKVTAQIDATQISVDYNQNAARRVPALCLAIRDEGIGIPEDELETVFDRFFQTSKTTNGYGGTGLGLAICREIVSGHHGRIWAENNPEGGAIFKFVLPIKPLLD